MTREEAKRILIECRDDELYPHITEALDMAIEALKQEPTDDATLKDIFCMGCECKEQEPCTDAVSRQAIYDELEKWEWQELYLPIHFKENIVDVLPPVEPTRPKGKWRAIYQGDEIIDYRCSECEFGSTFGKSTYRMNYCPHCGADMREGE